VTRVVALFDSPPAVERAIETVRNAGGHAVGVCAPAFDEKLLQAAGATRSPVAVAAVSGGVFGIACGFALTIGRVREWPGLIVSGKPLLSMPPFLIIVFELAILMAAIAAAVAFLIASKRARQVAGAACGPATTDNRFALLVESTSSREIVALLQSAGAVEWRVL